MSNWFKRTATLGVAKARDFLFHFGSSSRGNTLAMTAAAIFPIAGMIGSGLDMSRAYMAQAKLQNACDASALAARRVMVGASWTSDAQSEGERFFDFNFPSSTMDSQNLVRTIAQSTDNALTVAVTASADIPTTIMGLFGKEVIPISVSCNANQDYGNNDIMVVLDVTTSMKATVSGTGSTRIELLRDGTMGLYRALSGASETRTRYGILPYSASVNVARNLENRDILRDTYYFNNMWVLNPVNIQDSQWAARRNTEAEDIQSFRESGDGCIEERPSIGNSDHPIRISTTVTRDDIDLVSTGDNDRARQWGRYDRDEQVLSSGAREACPEEATRLQTYTKEAAYRNAIRNATATVEGNTYHDIGIVWAARFLSSTGMFAGDNPEIWNGIPVSRHIVFFTDGDMCPQQLVYSSYGVERYEERVTGPGTTVGGCANDRLGGLHIDRFMSGCSLAKSMGMTIWVVAFDNTDTREISPCATSDGHFYTSNGRDLEEVFTRIGQGMARLRLSE